MNINFGSEPSTRFLSRNQLIRSALIGLSSLVLFGNAEAKAILRGQTTSDPVPKKLKTALHQEVEIATAPDHVYKALLSSDEFSLITGAKAEISTKEGGRISMFDGAILGRNIELVENQRIVQAWRPGSWKLGVYSVVKFELKSVGDKTIVVLDHTGFPEGDFESLGGGWISHYWEPMKKHFSK